MPTIGKYYLLEVCDNFTSFLRIIFVVFEIVSCVLFTFLYLLFYYLMKNPDVGSLFFLSFVFLLLL